MKLLKSSRLLFALPLMILGCGGGSTNESAQLGESSSPKQLIREMNPNATSTEILAVKKSSNEFSMELYKQLKNDNDSFFTSSYTTYTMMNMLWAGSDTQTYSQMRDVLGVSMDDEKWHTSLNALDLSFSRVSDSFDLEIANAIWVQDGMVLNKTFEDTLKTNYGAEVKKVDFSDSENSRLLINDWTKQTTHDKITELLPQGAISENSKLIVTNAIYLKAKWQKRFSSKNTKDGNFTLANGKSVSTKMMYQKNRFRHAVVDGVKMLCMNYNDSDFRLLTFMPPVGQFEIFEENMSEEVFLEMVANMPEHEEMIEIYYPKFEFETTISLNKALQNIGLTDAFQNHADFSKISSEGDFSISQIIQKTFLKIDEDGTQAASSTAAVLGTTSESKAKLEFNRPFLFALCHAPTKTVLFLGRMMNPASK